MRLAAHSLPPAGVLVVWGTSRILSPIPQEGEPIVVNELPTRLVIKRLGCGDIGADEVFIVVVPLRSYSGASNIWLIACLRGPGLAAAEAHVRQLLTSIRGP